MQLAEKIHLLQIDFKIPIRFEKKLTKFGSHVN
jgi:hypothetical protein